MSLLYCLTVLVHTYCPIGSPAEYFTFCPCDRVIYNQHRAKQSTTVWGIYLQLKTDNEYLIYEKVTHELDNLSFMFFLLI